MPATAPATEKTTAFSSWTWYPKNAMRASLMRIPASASPNCEPTRKRQAA